MSDNTAETHHKYEDLESKIKQGALDLGNKLKESYENYQKSDSGPGKTAGDEPPEEQDHSGLKGKITAIYDKFEDNEAPSDVKKGIEEKLHNVYAKFEDKDKGQEALDNVKQTVFGKFESKDKTEKSD